jgi:hypothetical protein
MSLQGKLLQSRPGDARSTAQHVQAGTVVLSSKHVRDAVLGAITFMLKQDFAADLQ